MNFICDFCGVENDADRDEFSLHTCTRCNPGDMIAIHERNETQITIGEKISNGEY